MCARTLHRKKERVRGKEDWFWRDIDKREELEETESRAGGREGGRKGETGMHDCVLIRRCRSAAVGFSVAS